MRIAWIAFPVLALAACASVPSAPPPPPTSGSTIAVLPLVGPEFELKHIGLTAFENSSDSCPAAPLNPDEHVRETARQEVEQAAPGVRYVELACGDGRKCFASDFAGAYGYVFPGGPDTFKPGSLTPHLRNVLATTPADRVLVIYRHKVEGEPNLGKYIKGVGIFHRSMLGLLPRGYVHASLGAALIDGRTLEVLSSHNKVTQGALDEAIWPGADCGEITPEQRTAMIDSFRNVLDEEVQALLSHFGLSKAVSRR